VTKKRDGKKNKKRPINVRPNRQEFEAGVEHVFKGKEGKKQAKKHNAQQQSGPGSLSKKGRRDLDCMRQHKQKDPEQGGKEVARKKKPRITKEAWKKQDYRGGEKETKMEIERAVRWRKG